MHLLFELLGMLGKASRELDNLQQSWPVNLNKASFEYVMNTTLGKSILDSEIKDDTCSYVHYKK